MDTYGPWWRSGTTIWLGSNKFESTHDVYALYKEFEDIIWDKIGGGRKACR